MAYLPASELNGYLEAYVVSNDIRSTTVAYYRRVVGQFRKWLALHPAHSEITELSVSSFLLYKQDAGRKSHYRKSLRNGILAVLGETVDPRKVRRVKLEPLDPRTFSRAEVGQLIRACRQLSPEKAEYYAGMIAAGYYTGLSQVDLHRIDSDDVATDGTLEIARSRTGKLAVVWIPPALLERLPKSGKLFPRKWSDEQFRRDFRKICRIAGVVGTFKLLRKTSGTEADLQTGGLGHTHLANSRKVFEQHYADKRRYPRRKPVKLRRVGVA